MRLHAFVIAFMGVWMSGATLGGVTVAIAALASGKPAGLLKLALPLAGAAIGAIPFALEARIAKQLLREIFAQAPGYPPQG